MGEARRACEEGSPVFSVDKSGLRLFLEVSLWLLPVCTYVSAPSSSLVNIVIAFIIMFGV